MGTRVIFVRHGETDMNHRRVMQGAVAAELNGTGHKQAHAAAKALAAYAPSALYSSPYLRALQTAHIISEALKLPVNESTRLREQGLGEWENRSWEEITAADPAIQVKRHTGGWWFCPPGGEPRLRVRHRMLAFIGEAQQAHPDATVVAVTHGGALYFMAHALLDRVPLGAAVMRFDNCGFTVVEAAGERVRLITLNETQHLQELQE